MTRLRNARFRAMTELDRDAEKVADPLDASVAVLRRCLEAAAVDKAFQWAMLGSDAVEWEGIKTDKDAFAAAARVIHRAVTAGVVRHDLPYTDFPVMTCGVMSTMYFRPNGTGDWRRKLALLLEGLKPTASAARKECP